MKYKYTRKDIYKFIKSVKRWKDISCIIEDLLLATEDKTKKMSFNDFVVNNHHLWNKGCKICGCKSEFAHYEGCPVLGTVLGTKVKPTPSSLEIEETEEIKIPMVLIKPRPNDIVDFITCDITPKLNSLIRNQRLIVKQLKIK